MSEELEPWRLYLANLERYLPTHSLRQIRLMSHCHQNRVAFWRRTIEEFRLKEAELLAVVKKLESTMTRAQREAEVRFPRRFRLYMDLLRKFDNRLQACEEAGLTWAEVKRGLGDHSGFKADYDAWLDEQNIRLEDAQAKKGLGGDSSAARAVLQARDPRYRGKTAPGGGDSKEPQSEADKFFESMEASARVPREKPDVDDEAEADA